MVPVGEVPVAVCHRQMPVRMAVAGVRIDAVFMGMLVVFVMPMFVSMCERRVHMVVCMVLGQMQPHTERHQRAGNQQRRRDGFTQQHDSQQRAEEGCH